MESLIPLNGEDLDGQYRKELVASLRTLAEKLDKELESDSIAVISAITLLTNDCIVEQKKLANHYYTNGSWCNAARSYEKCCLHNESDFVSMFYLANAYKNLGLYNDAILAYEKSLLINEYPEGLVNLSSTYKEMGADELHFQCLERLVNKFPNYSLGYYNLGIYWYEKRNLRKSIQCYRTALAVNPDHGLSKIGLALSLLMDGQYVDGFLMYENRWGVLPNCPIREFNSLRWQGEAVPLNSSILIALEQGFGDTLMMARYIPEILRLFAKVFIEVRPEMRRLISRCYPSLITVLNGEQLPITDYHCPIMSLPHAFVTSGRPGPNIDQYLSIVDLNFSAGGLIKDKKPRVGVCWRCGGLDSRTTHRSISHTLIDNMLNEDCYSWISLTKDIPPEEFDFLFNNTKLTNEMDRVSDFYDTYRLIEGLDLVVTVDTVIAHLAGAMGKPTIIILNEGYDWKWTVNDKTSVWYPKANLLRAYALDDIRELSAKIMSTIIDMLH